MNVRALLALYWIVTLVNLIGKAFLLGTTANAVIGLCTMTIVMPILALYYWKETSKNRTVPHKWITAGFMLSWVGDVSLMLPDVELTKPYEEQLFLIGLVSFLIAHLFYIAAFVKHVKLVDGKSYLAQKPWMALPLVAYLAALLYTVLPTVTPQQDQAPVAVYGGVITLMCIAALNRFGKVSSYSFWMTFVGAVLFLLSDSTIAISHFYQHFTGAEVLIMSTYLVAQYMIAKGTINNH